MLMTKHLTIEVNNEVVKHRVAFILLVKSQYLEEPIDLEKNYTYTSSIYAWDTGWILCSNKKASMLHYLLEEYMDDVQISRNASHIQDGNSHFYTLTKIQIHFVASVYKFLNIWSERRILYSPRIVMRISSLSRT